MNAEPAGPVAPAMRFTAAIAAAFLAVSATFAAPPPPATPHRASWSDSELVREIEGLRREVAALTGAARHRGTIAADRASLAREIADLRREIADARAAAVPVHRIGGNSGGKAKAPAPRQAAKLQPARGGLGAKRKL